MAGSTRRPNSSIQGPEQQEETINAETNGNLRCRQRNTLIQALLRHLIRKRSRGGQSLCGGTPTQPSTHDASVSLHVLTKQEAEACDAVCRFCFDGYIDNDENQESSANDKNGLVAPCNCSGGSKWIHKKCLQQWQLQILLGSYQSSSASTEAASICNVCKSPYLIGPPTPLRIRKNMFHRGTLLVYNSNETANTFYRTVVLLLNHPNYTACPYGLVLNAPLGRLDQVPLAGANSVEWKRGGPVCGGRLGVNKYIVAHTSTNIEQQGPYLSIPVFDNQDQQHQEQAEDTNHHGRLQILVSAADRRPLVPALLNRHELEDVVQRLSPQHEQKDESAAVSTQVFAFLGYCKWRSGQLEREVQRGAWRVCNNASDHDVLQNSNFLWNDMMRSNNRLMSPLQLLEEPHD